MLRIGLDSDLLLSVIFIGWRSENVSLAIQGVLHRVVIWPQCTELLFRGNPQTVSAVRLKLIAPSFSCFRFMNSEHIGAASKAKENDARSNF